MRKLFGAHIRWRSRCATRMCSADPECTQHSSIPISEAPVLFDLTTKSAKKLVVEPPATVGLGLCSDAFHDVSYDSLFAALELSALKPWLVRPAKGSDCTVTVCGSHVKRVSTRSDCTDLDAGLFLFWHGEMLRVRRSLADLPSAARTCLC